MKKFINNLLKLVNVKTIVTLLITIVFCILTLKKSISGEQFLTIFAIIISFYFGKKHEKNRENNEKQYIKMESIEINEKKFDEKLYKKNIMENNFDNIENVNENEENNEKEMKL